MSSPFPIEPYQPEHVEPEPAPAVPPPPRNYTRVLLGLGAALGLAGLVVVGVVATGREEPAAQTTPAVQVQQTAPPACLDALSKGEHLMELERTALGYAAAGMRAAGNLDAAGIDEQTANAKALTPQVSAAVADYQAAAALCRG